MREDVHATVNCIVSDDVVNAMPNMQKTLLQYTTLNCLDKIVCYLQRIHSSNRKLKQQVRKLADCIKIGCVFKNQ